MTLVIDEGGVYYRVPISCINEPLNYSVNVSDQKLKSKIVPAEKMFNVRDDLIIEPINIDVKGTLCERRLHAVSIKPGYDI